MSTKSKSMFIEKKSDLRSQRYSVLAKPLLTDNPHIYETYKYLRLYGANTVALSLKEVLFGRHDVLHIHWPDRIFYSRIALVKLILFCLLLKVATWRRISVIYTCHNFLPKNKVSPLLLRAYFGVLRRYVSGLIVPRSDMAGHLSRIFTRSKVIHIPLGLSFSSEKAFDSKSKINEAFPDLELPDHFILIPGVQESTKKTEEAVDFILKNKQDLSILVVGRFPRAEYKSYLDSYYATEPRVVIIDAYLEESVLFALCQVSCAVIASQKGGTNSGIALMSLALNVPCFCATERIAQLVQQDYQTQLVQPLSKIGDDAVWKLTQELSEFKKGDIKSSFSIESSAKRMLKFMMEVSHE